MPYWSARSDDAATLGCGLGRDGVLSVFQAINTLASGSGGSDEYEALRKHLEDCRSHFDL